MKRNAVGKNGDQLKSGFWDDVWNTVRWLTSQRIGAHRRYRTHGAGQAQHGSAFASQNERTVAGMVADAMPGQGIEETKQQEAALNAWEDEGGKTAASASTHGCATQWSLLRVWHVSCAPRPSVLAAGEGRGV
jgi:hypothetical protein